MKKLIIPLLFPPLLSFAQKIEISEQAGCSVYSRFVNNQFNEDQSLAFSNQVSAVYHVNKYLALGALYEYEAWNAANNSYGVVADVNTKHFFAGLEGKLANIATYTIAGTDDKTMIKYKPSLAIGAHVGAKQKLIGHLSLVEQLGYSIVALKGTATNVSSIGIGAGIKQESDISATVRYPYLRVGLSYAF